MNEIADGGRMAPDAPLVSEPTRPEVRVLELLFSPEFDQLAGALAKAQLTIQNPEKNREVEVYSKRTDKRYKFKFADYAAVMNAVRKPLAENGLVITHLHRGKRLYSMMLHESGQWMRSEVELIMDSVDNQEFGSATSYMERYAVRSMCGLATEEDDDGNIAAGNDWRDAKDRRQQPRAPAGDAPHPLLEHARQVKDIFGGRSLLSLWLRHRPEVEKLRNDETQQELWSSIVGELSAALDRAFGITVAAAWKSWQLATTRDHEIATRAKWDGTWAETLERFHAAEPVAYSDLVRHMNAACERIVAAPRSTAPAPANVPAEEPRRQPEEPQFSFQVLDAQGDACTGPYIDSALWALAYEHVFKNTPEGLRETLAEFNAEALTEADKHVGAAVILSDLYAAAAASDGTDGATADPPSQDKPASEQPTTQAEAPPSEPATPAQGDESVAPEMLLADVPLNRNNAPDMIGYFRNAEATLRLVNSAADMAVWEELNEPVFMSERIGSSTRLKVMKAAAGRKRELGISLPNAA